MKFNELIYREHVNKHNKKHEYIIHVRRLNFYTGWKERYFEMIRTFCFNLESLISLMIYFTKKMIFGSLVHMQDIISHFTEYLVKNITVVKFYNMMEI